MNLSLAVNLGYRLKSTSTLILNLLPLRWSGQKIIEEKFETDRGLLAKMLGPDPEGNLFLVYEIEGSEVLRFSYQGKVQNSYTLSQHERDEELQLSKLEHKVLKYLLPSRYCQSDKFYRFAMNQFGSLPNSFEKVLAINNWIQTNVEYLSGSTDSQTSALDTLTEQVGVCRDFAHLGIALCRALTIPARYFSCYAYGLNPPDFHACYEAYLGGIWLLFDPTGHAQLNGLVKVATGRDAADTAIANTFGEITLETMKVVCDREEQAEPFCLKPFEGISYSNCG